MECLWDWTLKLNGPGPLLMILKHCSEVVIHRVYMWLRHQLDKDFIFIYEYIKSALWYLKQKK